jgi:ABC-type molybdenum transport system ATPase subunit/photorepair protein PhrA
MALFDLSEADASYNGNRVLKNVSLSVEAGERIYEPPPQKQHLVQPR